MSLSLNISTRRTAGLTTQRATRIGAILSSTPKTYKEEIVKLGAYALMIAVILAAGIAPAEAEQAGKVTCAGAHYIRSTNDGGQEIALASIVVRNLNTTDSVTIQRLTIRDLFGNVVHDSGPDIGVPHPLTHAIVPPLDITTVPPGAVYFGQTIDIWGLDSIPAGNQNGVGLSAIVKFSTPGRADLVDVTDSRIVRRRLISPTTGAPVQGEELTRLARACV